ncbi:MAG: MFS transporter [Nitrospinaceae bacterium]|nr:MFS transporter [Nitrospinaceae bacterium]
MSRSIEERLKPRIWYGWVILAVMFTVMAILIGARNSLGFFFKEMSAEFGWNRAQIAAAYSIGMIFQGLTSPISGWLSDRWSMRWTISAGIFIGGSSFLIGFTIHSLWQLYAMYALLSVGFALATFIPQVYILSNWFNKRRGLAMGISTSSQGLAPMLNLAMPPLIAMIGWRMSYIALAIFIILFACPLAALFLRNSPEEKDTVPDAPFLDFEERMSIAAQRTIPLPMEAPAPPSLMSRILTLRFLLLGGVYASLAYIFTGTAVHLVPHATDQGFTLSGASIIFLIWGFCIMAGNFASAISDRIGRTPTHLIGTALGIAAMFTLALFGPGANPLQFHFGAALSGLSIGLLRPTISTMTADHFEGPGFGKLNGAIMVRSTLASGVDVD